MNEIFEAERREIARRQRASRTLRAPAVAGTPVMYDVDTRELPPWERVDLARFGEQEPPVGTLLRWRGRDDVLRFAFRSPEGWLAFVGTTQHRWPDVAASMIGDSECHVAVSWREIPRPEPAASGDDAVRDWASQFLPESASEVVESAGDQD